ncbi:acetoacetate--CoA ligase [Rhodococcus sp. 14C212]|uniref:acetoacetate--CoA ligase n=1 Tax=Rhodococcus sp. 14C212 TaxID=2711209 RepID=UPI0013EA857A|nr:acetoacetate--CoA ligase [Rhodococcus sp. 14C212]NGP05798.1 acetoacetate--CoA ligase [Rhodococcus sp. 14C212]
MHTPARPELPLWSPTAEQITDSTLTEFTEYVRATHHRHLGNDYDELWRWSVTDLDGFWSAVWHFFGLDQVSGFDRALADDTMPHARWFTGARVNFAQVLLDRGEPDAVAVIGADETGHRTSLTRAELRDQVRAVAATLTAAGVRPGDVVVGYLPNIPEAVVAFLATAVLGATWSSVAQDYAAPAVIDRIAQLAPTALIAADGYHFNGRTHPRLDEVAAIAAALPTVTTVVLIDHLGIRPSRQGTNWMHWSTALENPAPVEAVTAPFDHPLWVLFSSGTTGIPKGLVHSHGGILVETLKQMGLHWDLRPHDRLLWYTTPSWVMWNMQVSALLMGASIVCYDGSPTSPDPSRLWQMIDDLEITFFGTSPGFLQASATAGLTPADQFDLSHLRAIGSTGSPLAPHLHQWAREHIGDLPLWSMSGGTDVAGGFVGGAPTVPIRAGTISVRCLGAAIEAWNEHGTPVVDEVGELVVTRPMPSMPIRLWNDPDGTKYEDAYYSMYPGIWRQGDWITVSADGTVIIHGRSDSTLNRNGVRMGSGDIYAAVETMTEVAEALVLGVEQSDGTYWMPLFVHLADGHRLDPALEQAIRATIRDLASPRHVPDEIIEVVGIPHTRTGKKLEVPLKRLLRGEPLSAVVNPDTVDDPALLLPFLDLADRRLEATARR